MRNRVAEFVGPEALAEAGQAVLTDPRLDMAVVRRVLEPEAGVGFGGTEEDIAAFYGAVPQAHGLDEVIEEWWNSHEGRPRGYNLLTGIQAAVMSFNGIKSHIDLFVQDRPRLEGPLTLSIRVDDQPDIPRVFYARRLGHSTLRPNGHRAIPPNVDGFGFFLGLSRYRLKSIFSKADHNPGDAIVIPNHPHPSAHIVEAKGPREASPSRSLVLAYKITKQNANNSAVKVWR